MMGSTRCKIIKVEDIASNWRKSIKDILHWIGKDDIRISGKHEILIFHVRYLSRRLVSFNASVEVTKFIFEIAKIRTSFRLNTVM